MATFVLIHGSWHWGGCYLKVANLLAAKGHVVSCPDLLTCGYDPTVPGTVPDLAAYAAPARAMIEAADGKVILVGHSMGGVSCTYLGELLPEKISRIVYLSAFLCPDGKTANDYIFSPAYLDDPLAKEFFQIASADPAGVRINLDNVDLVKAAFYTDCSDHDVSIAAKNVIPVCPAAGNVWVTQITPERFGSVPRAYIECLEDKALPLPVQRQMQADMSTAGYEVATHAITASHSPFFSKPEELADMLHGMA